MSTNKIVYFEVPADDMGRAKKFYNEAFGWEIKDMGEDYASIQSGETDEYMHSVEKGAITGGIQKRGERAVAPTVVVQVEDIEEALLKVEKAGGKIVIPKENMADMGWYAQFNDSEGNRIGVFQKK
jgi:hypothetical protein